MRSLLLPVLVLSAASGAAVAARGSDGVWIDDLGDAAFRRTDSGNNGMLPPGIDPIDLVGVTVTGWQTLTPTTDPYSGTVAQDADLMRIRLEFDGLVAPPGPIGIGQAGGAYDPLRFGDRPVYGFIDFDIDDDKDTGGELAGAAQNRYLANVGRFGMTPHDSISERVAVWSEDLDTNFYSVPQYERTGAEMTFVMCGCWIPQIISQDGNMDG
ncbi:MAG: hypothetical protein D6695_03090, partial [Planctomycetota bacterium]